MVGQHPGQQPDVREQLVLRQVKFGEQVRERLIGRREDGQRSRAGQRVDESGGDVRVHPERLRAGALSSLAALLQSAGERLQSWSRKTDEALNESLLCEVGEITSAGTLTCLNCGHTIQLGKTGHIPPCPECYQGRFRKSY